MSRKEVSYIISVSVGVGCYRHIKASSKLTLFEFHETILEAFDFIDDHAHAFFMNNRVWDDDDSYYADFLDEDGDRYTKDFVLGSLGLYVGMQFKYVFDFGDEWKFHCKVLKILDEKTAEPKVVLTKGEAPSQYSDCDEFDDED